LSRDSDEKNNNASARPIRCVGVLGAGTMGHGIAQVAAAAGYAVVMRDVNTEALARGVQSIERNLAKAIQLGKITEQQRDEILQRIRGATRFEEISPRDIDTAMELGYNHPMRPLRLTDLVGLYVRLNIAEYLYLKLGSETFRPPDILRRLVSEGKLGKKTGEGFYNWSEQEKSQRVSVS